jgi:hypothetical protein
MPRPNVEVHQRVLNPIVTINDPQQRVCIVGLHTEEFKDEPVYILDRTEALEYGDDIPESSAIDLEFDINVDGVLINKDIELGDTGIEGDLTLVFSKPQVNMLNVLGVTRTISSGNHLPGDGFSVVSGQVTTAMLTRPSLKLLVNPSDTLCSFLVVDSGAPGLNFTTGNYTGASAPISALATLKPGYDVTLSGLGSFVVRAVAAGGIYLGSTTVDQHEKLLANDDLTLTISGTAIQNVTFKLVSPGIQEVGVDGASSTVNKLVLQQNLLFDIVYSYNAKCALTCEYDTQEVTVSELDATNPLVVTSTLTGDATVTVPKEVLTISGVGHIIRATALVSYTVAKNTLSSTLQPVNVNNITDVLGLPSPQNPLALAAELALLNAPSTQVFVLALDLSPVDGSSEQKSVDAAFLEALSVLERSRDVYAMVPLTTSQSTTVAYAKSAEAMSLPRRGKFRICLGSGLGSPAEEFVIGSRSTYSTTGLIVDEAVTDEAQNFRSPSSRVLVGDNVVAVDADSVTYTGVVSDVTAASLTVTWDDTAPDGNVSYRVSRSLLSPSKKARQIELLSAVVPSIASKRLFLTFPGLCTVASSLANSSFQNQPSYYVTAAFSGLIAATDIHRPKNFLGVQGIKLNDIARFSDDELDAISDSGYLVFQQNTAESAPFCVHQVNTYHGTNPGTQEFTELSVISNYDFVSAYFKNILDPFAGTVNIVPEVLATIRSSLQAAITNLQARKVVGIGAPVISGSVDIVRQASFDSGTVEASVSVRLPKVLNKIILEVVSA